MKRCVADASEGAGCSAIAAGLVVDYSGGRLADVAAWSVEKHIPGCDLCRSVLSDSLDQHRLSHNRSIVVARLALVEHRRVPERLSTSITRATDRLGIPSHIWRLLSVTPSLRRSWLAGITIVLGVAILMARLVTFGSGQAVLHLGSAVVPESALPFLLLTPLLPLAGVAAAFHPRLDPAAQLAMAAPISGAELFFVRSVAVIGTAVAPIVLAGFALPGAGWLPLLLVSPALAVSLTALALATVVPPLPAAVAAGVLWAGLACGVGADTGSAVVVYGNPAQVGWLIVIATACSLLGWRRHTLDRGWNR